MPQHEPPSGAQPAGLDHRRLPDAELTQLLRVGSPTARAAVADEIRSRHLDAVLRYTRICTAGDAAARELAERAFTHAVRRERQGSGDIAWRPYLLLCVQRTAARWIEEGRVADLAPAFAVWLDEVRAGRTEGEGPPRFDDLSIMLHGFRRLPPRTQVLLWHCFVERESDQQVARLLGLEPGSVAALADGAGTALRTAYLRAHLDNDAREDCHRFSRMIEAVSRPGGPPRSEDLNAHLAGCRACTQAIGDLFAMGDDLPTALVEGLLLWGGPAYVAARPHSWPPPPAHPPAPVPAAEHRAGGHRAARPARSRGAAGRRGRPSLVAVLVSGTAALAVAAITAALVSSGSSGSRNPSPSGIAVPAPPAATETVTAPPPSGPTASPSPSAPEPSASSSPPKASDPPPPKPSASAPPAGEPPHAVEPHAPPRGDDFTQYVNARSGLCLDIQGRIPQPDRNVIVRTCEPVSTQKWNLDDRGLLRNYSDPDLCLDSRGAGDRGPGLAKCSAVDSRHGHNVRFYLSGKGALRPFVAHELALAQHGSSGGLRFVRADGSAAQRWNAGASITSARD
ncbi:RICIN domain-containing protein [Streptomyces sp. 549]|uniref:RICIN domain-containing protein n=1 Tax=Streptomyces sp. 549 TaxID=3049076 RepID=UPI0024C251E8|nr:RICIN domain-containing protein [Streptomyces sp. 549]MDK1477038.1 RICIN domain-containing protein [Streptomyces sp. 549]